MGQVFGSGYRLAKYFKVSGLCPPDFQAVRAEKIVPDIPGILMVFQDHMIKIAH